MEAALQRVTRLIGALETLSEQQTFLLNSDEFEQAVEVIERSAPLVEEIARLMLEPGVSRSLAPAIQVRAQKLFRHQGEQLGLLAAKKTTVSEHLQELASLRSRSFRFRSAYGAANASRGSAVLADQA